MCRSSAMNLSTMADQQRIDMPHCRKRHRWTITSYDSFHTLLSSSHLAPMASSGASTSGSLVQTWDAATLRDSAAVHHASSAAIVAAVS